MEYRLDDLLTFGTHSGRTVKEVIDNDADYIEWALNNTSGFELDEDAMRYLGAHYWQMDG